jgi:mono/diheme cytochrome c family protein
MQLASPPVVEVLMFRRAAVLGLFLLLVPAGFSQDKQPPQKENVPPPASANLVIPPEEAKRENPVKPTEASLAEGKKLYGYQCAMCHGEKGDGKGDMVEPMKLTLKDYTNADSLKGLTDGALFYILEKGKGKMPGQEGRMKVEQQWSLVNYIRSLAKKSGEAPKPPDKPE